MPLRKGVFWTFLRTKNGRKIYDNKSPLCWGRRGKLSKKTLWFYYVVVAEPCGEAQWTRICCGEALWLTSPPSSVGEDLMVGWTIWTVGEFTDAGL